jgi:hypothetical protein
MKSIVLGGYGRSSKAIIPTKITKHPPNDFRTSKS